MRQYEKTTKLTAISEFSRFPCSCVLLATNENSSTDKLSGTINNSEFPSHQKRIGHISACFETETSSNRDT